MTSNVGKNNYCVLIRDAENLYGEKEIMKELDIPFVEYRSEVPENSLIIGRYSVIPFYQELEKDLQSKNSRLINTYNQFRFSSDLGNWYQALEEFTPKTWFSLQEYLASSYEGPVVLKGETNSRRDKWKTKKGKPTGQVPWNKGKKIGPMSEEHKQKHAEALANKPGPNKGREFSQEWKDKLAKAKLGKPGNKKGKKLTPEQRENISKAKKGVKWKRVDQM